MKVYLVRRVEDKGILGVFWGSPACVWDCIDEIADPSDYEAAVLERGAIYACDKEPVWSQWENEDSDLQPEDFSGYTPSEGLGIAIRDQESLRWKRLDYADEGVGLIARIRERLPAK